MKFDFLNYISRYFTPSFVVSWSVGLFFDWIRIEDSPTHFIALSVQNEFMSGYCKSLSAWDRSKHKQSLNDDFLWEGFSLGL